MDRLQQKHDLFIKLGMLFGPLFQLVENPDRYDEQEEAETLARYFSEVFELTRDFDRFTKGQPGHEYRLQSNQFSASLQSIRASLQHGMLLKDIVYKQFEIARAAINAVPIPRTSVILEAGSPFTTYCKLKQLCEVDATKSLAWLDPYMASDIFHRYVSGVRAEAIVVLVTSEPGQHAGNKYKSRWAEFLDVSRLYAQERGPTKYMLVVQPNLHDRWVIFDTKRIYSLGGSAKDAGDKDYFTIASVEASDENQQKIRQLIATGIEYFGPNAHQHK